VARVTPPKANNRVINWTSDREDVATVSSNGAVTGVSAGAAVITATTLDGGFTASCAVEVNRTVTGVGLNSYALPLIVGGSYQLVATVSPSSASDRAVNWSSSNRQVAAVTASGLVIGVSIGTANITAAAEGLPSSPCAVEVTNDAVGLRLSPALLDLNLGASAQLSAALVLQNGRTSGLQNAEVAWSSSNASVAGVSTSGLVTANSLGIIGSATITATYGGFTSSCTVSVALGPPAGLVIEPDSLSLRAGQAHVLIAKIRYAGGYIAPVASEVTWETDNDSVAIVNDEPGPTVSDIGKVRAIAQGSATITATLNGIAGSCEVTVLPPDVYIATTETLDDGSVQEAYLWKSGAETPMLLSSGGGGASALYIADGGLVYVAGWQNDGGQKIATLWIYDNDSGTVDAVSLSALANDSEAKSVHGIGNDIYVAGYQSNGTLNTATLWNYPVGGPPAVAKQLGNGTEPSEAKSVQSAGGIVYVAGQQNDSLDNPHAAFWIWDIAADTVVAPSLGENASFAAPISTANSVRCHGRSAYIAGREEDSDDPSQNAAMLWIYKAPAPLETPTPPLRLEIQICDGDPENPITEAEANSVFAADDYVGVFVVGYRKNTDILGNEEAMLWVIQDDAEAPPIIAEFKLRSDASDARASSVFRLGSGIYVAGEKAKTGGLYGWNWIATGWRGSDPEAGLEEWQTWRLITDNSINRASKSAGVGAR